MMSFSGWQRLVFLTVVLPTARSEITPAQNAAISAAVEGVLKGQAAFWNTSFQASYVGSLSNPASPGFGLDVSVAAGIEDFSTQALMTPNSVIPMGSITKSATMVAVLRVIQNGGPSAPFTLDSKVIDLADKLIGADNGTTLREIFAKTADDPSTSIANLELVTVRDLLGMSSGLQDYNDTQFRTATESDPTMTVTPYDLLWSLNKTFFFTPGAPGQKAYSSVGFEILGLILAQAAGATSWTQYSQLHGAIPPTLLPMMNATYFPTSGLCSAIPNMVTQYAVNTTAAYECERGILVGPACFDALFETLIDTNCVNGWACGNIAATTANVARFYNLLGDLALVQDMSLMAELGKFGPLTHGWCSTCNLEYSLGLMIVNTGLNASLQQPPNAILAGHGGQDYGSSGTAGLNTPLSIGTAIGMGSAQGMAYTTTSGPGKQCNASNRTPQLSLSPAFGLNGIANQFAQCAAYATFLAAAGFTTAEEKLYIDFRASYNQQWVFCDQIDGGAPPPAKQGLGVKQFQCTPPQQFIYYDCASSDFAQCCAASGTNCTLAGSLSWFIQNPLCTGYIPCLPGYVEGTPLPDMMSEDHGFPINRDM